MARLSKSALFDRVTTALTVGGWNYLILVRAHPFELLIYRGDESYRTRVYIWNITHGGNTRAADEFRIQITSGVGRFSIAGAERTLVLGWWENVGVFAGFDVSKHLQPLGSSPSIQITEGTLTQAAINGVATYRKSTSEIAIGFVPSFLGEYTARLSALHEIAASARDLAALDAVIANPEESEEPIARGTSGARKKVLAEVAKQLRDASFTERVLTAYGRSCAMCGVQLRIIDAAHILPAAKTDDDSTSNGLALCGSHHRAFDRALITLTPDYGVVFNPANLARLKASMLDGGWREFRSALRPQILLPPDRRDRPNPDRITEVNALRGWSHYEPVAT